MIESPNYVVFDFETGGLLANHHEAIEVAGKVYDGRTLEPVPAEQGGEFSSLMKPLHFDRLEDGALRVNGIAREELAAAPDQKAVWLRFVEWVKGHSTKKGVLGLPFACGKNIDRFDLAFVAALNRLHHPKGEKAAVFNPRMTFDLEKYVHDWLSRDPEIPNAKMDTLREYFGMSTRDAHRAIVDVRQTGELLMRFKRLIRELTARKDRDGRPFIQFKNSLAGVC